MSTRRCTESRPPGGGAADQICRANGRAHAEAVQEQRFVREAQPDSSQYRSRSSMKLSRRATNARLPRTDHAPAGLLLQTHTDGPQSSVRRPGSDHHIRPDRARVRPRRARLLRASHAGVQVQAVLTAIPNSSLCIVAPGLRVIAMIPYRKNRPTGELTRAKWSPAPHGWVVV